MSIKGVEVGMTIHCPTEAMSIELFKYLALNRYCWNGELVTVNPNYTKWDKFTSATCYTIMENKKVAYGPKKNDDTILFTDLTEKCNCVHNMLQGISEIAEKGDIYKVFGVGTLDEVFRDYSPANIIEAVGKWKSDSNKSITLTLAEVEGILDKHFGTDNWSIKDERMDIIVHVI